MNKLFDDIGSSLLKHGVSLHLFPGPYNQQFLKIEPQHVSSCLVQPLLFTDEVTKVHRGQATALTPAGAVAQLLSRAETALSLSLSLSLPVWL